MIISIEGNIGSGKSTLLDSLKSVKFCKPHIVLQEDVSGWTSFKDGNNMNILEHFYKDKERYSYCFQSLVLLNRIKHLIDVIKENPNQILILERSHYSDLNIFAKSLYDKSLMTEIEWKTYQLCHKHLNDILQNVKIDHIIYIKTSPKICVERIQKRNRGGEQYIQNDYIEMLHDKHEDWLIHTDIPLLEINGDIDIDDIQRSQILEEIVEYIDKRYE